MGKKLKSEIKSILIAGLIVVLPVSFTFFILFFLFTKLDGLLAPAATDALVSLGVVLPEGYRIPGIGVFATLLILFIAGIFSRIYFGRKLVAIGEYLFQKIPFVNSIYGSIKHVIETVTKADTTSFRRAVIIEYPRKGIYGIAFVTSETEGEVQLVTSEKVISVFVPTTPNPTSGFLLFIPESDTIPLTMSVEEGLKMVISGGIVTPPQSIEEIKRRRLEGGLG